MSLQSSTIESKDAPQSDSTPSLDMLVVPAVPSTSLRGRSYLVGNVLASKAQSVPDLDRHFPDRTFKLYVGSWNMQKCSVPASLDDFILPVHEKFLQDIYVIGVQESCQDQNTLYISRKHWCIKLQETIGPNYVLVHSMSHGVLHLAVFVRRDLIWYCSDFKENRITTRLISKVKTKGALGVSFRLFGSSFLFITAHFHSGETKVKERIDDYWKIVGQLQSSHGSSTTAYHSEKDPTCSFDGVFWFGDLNFRISQPHDFMKQEVADPATYSIKEALKCDQLKRNMERGKVFVGFKEPQIQFLPTYKFTPGTNVYDSSEKLRVPSYTDRILHRSKKNTTIDCVAYDSVPDLKLSDHQPVYAMYKVSLKPGRDNEPMGAGYFNREVYKAAAKKRANYPLTPARSAVCRIL